MPTKRKEEDALFLAEQIADAAMSHFKGDEEKQGEIIDYTGINNWARFLINRRRKLLEGIWNDPIPEDNNLIINLKEIENFINN